MTKNAIWITGAEGRLGSTLVELLKKNTDNKVVGTDMDVDITDMDEVEQCIKVYRPNIVINCASISDADYCEQNKVQAFKVNALGARNLAAASRGVNAKIVQLSTDDVFSGKNTGHLTEFDLPDPQDVYGKSKYAGENYVKELNPKHLIVRSSWVRRFRLRLTESEALQAQMCLLILSAVLWIKQSMAFTMLPAGACVPGMSLRLLFLHLWDMM